MRTVANAPAFPTNQPYDVDHAGLTTREYFAIHIMAAMCGLIPQGCDDIAQVAVARADALIAVLNEKE